MAMILSRTPIAGWLLAGALITSAPILWTHALPVFSGRAGPGHIGHAGLVFAHALGGTAMLLGGAAALYIGWTRRGFRWHKIVGYGYLGLGSLGALGALWLSILAPHEPASLYVATGTLSVVWLAVAAMALRAAINRRIEDHRAWMIRSYVLSWTFTGCRIATMHDVFPALGREGVTAAIWMNWVVPMILCEIALQWRRTGPAR